MILGIRNSHHAKNQCQVCSFQLLHTTFDKNLEVFFHSLSSFLLWFMHCFFVQEFIVVFPFARLVLRYAPWMIHLHLALILSSSILENDSIIYFKSTLDFSIKPHFVTFCRHGHDGIRPCSFHIFSVPQQNCGYLVRGCRYNSLSAMEPCTHCTHHNQLL